LCLPILSLVIGLSILPVSATAPKIQPSNLIEYMFLEQGYVGWTITEGKTKNLIELVSTKIPETKCIIQHESNYNKDAIGDGGKAYSYMQFHKPTFKQYNKKYQLNLDYKKGNHGIVLYYLMARDNRKNLYHWTTYKQFCS
jgi:hypothetical protein